MTTEFSTGGGSPRGGFRALGAATSPLAAEAPVALDEARYAADPAPSALPSRVLVIIPTYDEIENVALISSAVLEAHPSAEILFVDDASPDGTGEEIRRLGEKDERIRLLARSRKLGLGTAYLAGFARGLEGGYEAVVTMDADLSHDPSYLPQMLRALIDHDVAHGSRYVPGGGVRNWGLHRRALSRFANFYARSMLRVDVRDCTSGFRAYRADALRALPLDRIRSSGYSFLEEMTVLAARAGLSVHEVPIVFVDRQGGRSKISSREIFLAAYHVLRQRFSARRH